jgi:hypothetical protein
MLDEKIISSFKISPAKFDNTKETPTMLRAGESVPE